MGVWRCFGRLCCNGLIVLQSGDRAVLHCFALFYTDLVQFTAFLLLRAGVRAAMCAALVLQCGGVCAAYCSLHGVTTSCWMLFGVVWCCLVLFTVVCVCRRFRDARRAGVRAAMRAALVLHAALVLQCVVSFGLFDRCLQGFLECVSGDFRDFCDFGRLCCYWAFVLFCGDCAVFE